MTLKITTLEDDILQITTSSATALITADLWNALLERVAQDVEDGLIDVNMYATELALAGRSIPVIFTKKSGEAQ